MKRFSIVLLIVTFLAFLFYQIQNSNEFQVLKVVSPAEIIVDFNKNNIIDDDETITLFNIQSFSTKPDKIQSNLAKKLKLSEEDALGLGFFAENFAKETLMDKKIKLKNNNSQIWINNKNYEELLVNKGLAVKNGKPPSEIFWQNLKKVQKLNFVIFNNKSQKYHKLNCKYGLLAHNSQILPVNQVPKDAKTCRFCFCHEKFKKQNVKCKRQNVKDFIPDIKTPSTVFQTNSIKILLTDMTKVLKPSNTCHTPVCKALLNEINSAQNSIDFAIYGYTKIPAVQNAFRNAKARGVKIRFVYDSDEKNKNIYPDTLYLAELLKNNNHDLSSKIMHNKFFIFDGKTVLTGSANISNTDMSGFNSNVVVLINSKAIADIYTEEFEQMYCGKFHQEKKKIFDKEEGDFSVYFSPKDKCINEIIPLIDNAQKYIYIPAFLITHKGLTDSLINASKRGVPVKIILDATNTHSGSHSKINILRQAGIQVKTENWAGKLHSKSIIIDDLYTIIGSMNFSRSGEGVNDENMIVIKNPQITEFYRNFFFYLWKRIPDYWLAHNARAESPDSIGSCSDGIDNDFDGKIDKADDSCKIIELKR